MTFTDSLRECRASVAELRAATRRLGEAVVAADEAVAMLRDAAELLYEGESVRALARVREAAVLLGVGTVH